MLSILLEEKKVMNSQSKMQNTIIIFSAQKNPPPKENNRRNKKLKVGLSAECIQPTNQKKHYKGRATPFMHTKFKKRFQIKHFLLLVTRQLLHFYINFFWIQQIQKLQYLVKNLSLLLSKKQRPENFNFLISKRKNVNRKASDDMLIFVYYDCDDFKGYFFFFCKHDTRYQKQKKKIRLFLLSFFISS